MTLSRTGTGGSKMKVEGGNVQQAYAAFRATDAARAADQTNQQVGDSDSSRSAGSARMDISTKGRLRAQTLEAVRATPESREDLVAALKQQVQSGTYKVDT